MLYSFAPPTIAAFVRKSLAATKPRSTNSPLVRSWARLIHAPLTPPRWVNRTSIARFEYDRPALRRAHDRIQQIVDQCLSRSFGSKSQGAMLVGRWDGQADRESHAQRLARKPRHAASFHRSRAERALINAEEVRQAAVIVGVQRDRRAVQDEASPEWRGFWSMRLSPA